MSKTYIYTPRPGTISAHPLSATWQGMKARCNDPKSTSFKHYGGRGITVSDEWNTDFWKFVSDMGERPKGCTLDRIDNDGPYCKENCRWADRKTQAQNCRPRPKGSVKRNIIYDGQSGGLKFWSDQTGIKSQTIAKRLDAHWPVEQALGYEPRQGGLLHMGKKTRGVLVGPQGERHTLRTWAALNNVNMWNLRSRIVRRKMNLEDALDDLLHGGPRNSPVRTYTDAQGKVWTGKEMSQASGVPTKSIYTRMWNGWTVEEAMTKPYFPRPRS